MDNKFRIDWILANYVTESWNAMYEIAGKEYDFNIEEWNHIYTDKEFLPNVYHNTMYRLVESGSEIIDPEMKRDVENWNNGQLPQVHNPDEEYANVKAQRHAWRIEINELEAEISEPLK